VHWRQLSLAVEHECCTHHRSASSRSRTKLHRAKEGSSAFSLSNWRNDIGESSVFFGRSSKLLCSPPPSPFPYDYPFFLVSI
jgi:hypothetical protein